MERVKVWMLSPMNLKVVEGALGSACERFDGGRSGTFHFDVFSESLGMQGDLFLSEDIVKLILGEVVGVSYQVGKYWKVV